MASVFGPADMISSSGFNQSNPQSDNPMLTTSSQSLTSDTGEVGYELPVIGLPGPMFAAIHGVALFSLSSTTVVSCSLLIYLCTCRRTGRKRNQQQQPTTNTTSSLRSAALGRSTADVTDSGRATPTLSGTASKSASKSDIYNVESNSVDGSDDGRRKVSAPTSVVDKCKRETKNKSSFFSWNVGERLVVYLAICDLCLGISHILDHAYMMAIKGHPPDEICSTMAFFLLAAVLCQWYVVMFSAASACSLIVFGRKLKTGRYDWKLLLGTYGLAVLTAAVAFGLRLLGPSVAWCFTDMRTDRGRLFSQVLSFIQIFSFSLVTVAYGAIWIKIQRTARRMSPNDSRYSNSARLMMIFVAVFILQWWPLIVVDIWAMMALPPAGMLVTAVLVINLVGVYNCIVYIVIRRRLQQQKASRGPQVVLGHGDNINRSALTMMAAGGNDVTAIAMTSSHLYVKHSGIVSSSVDNRL